MGNLIENLHSKKPFSVSTDIVGVMGNPTHVIEFWRKIVGLENIPGLEVLAWKSLNGWSSPHIQGFHGRIGNRLTHDQIDNLKVWRLNGMTKPTPEVLSIAHQFSNQHERSVYVLVHQPEAETLKVSEIDTNDTVALVIENHVDEDAFNQAFRTTTAFRKDKVHTHQVIDLVHYLKEGKTYPDVKKWDALIALINTTGQCIIHLPIGTNPTDSLPFENITVQMWQGLKTAISRNNCYIVVEYQHRSLMANLRLNPNKDTRVTDDVIEKVKTLQANKLLRIR